MLDAYVLPPAFVSGTPVSATDLDILRKNAIMLFHVAQNTAAPVMAFDRDDYIYYNNPDTWLYVGAFKFHTGMTHFQLSGHYDIPAGVGINDVWKYYIGNVVDANDSMTIPTNLRDTKTLTGSADFAHDIPISALGFSDGQIVQVTVTVTQSRGSLSATNSQARYWVNAIAYPLTLSGWPGVPSFSGSTDLSETKLNQLSSACDWLADYLTMVPFYPQTSTVFDTLSFQRGGPNLYGSVEHWTYPDQSMWAGSAVSANGHTVFKIGGGVNTRDAEERYRLYRNANNTPTNNVVDEWPSDSTWSSQNATQAWELSYEMPPNSGAEFRMGNWLDVTTYTDGNGRSGGGADDPEFPTRGRSRHNIDYVRMEPPGALPAPDSSPYNSIFSATGARSNMAYSSLRSVLNAVGKIYTDTRNIITGNPLAFARVYIVQPGMFRRPQDWEWLHKTNKCRFDRRRGTRLWVRGRGVKIQYGPITIEKKEDGFEYKFLYEQEVIPGNALMSTYVYLDTLPGLFRGMPYYVSGSKLYYCVETMR